MKRNVCLILALCLTVSLFAACATNQPPAAVSEASSAASQSQTPESSAGQEQYDPMAYAGESLVMLRHTGYDADWMNEQFADFTKETGINVTMEQVAFSQLHDKIVVDLSAGSGSYDIIATPDYWLPEFTEGDWLADLRACIANPTAYNPTFDIDDIPQSLQEACSDGDKLVALPWKFNATILYYRSDLLPTPPATWDDLLDLAKQNTGDVKGIGMSMSKTSLPDVYNSMLVAFGGKLLSDDAKTCLLDSPEALEALNFLIELNSYGVEGSLSRHWDESAVLLAQGNTMTEIMVNTQVGNVTDPEKSQFPNDIAFAPLPEKVTRGAFMNTWTLAVTNGCETPEAGWALLQYLMSKEKLADLVEKTNGGIAPSRTSLLSDPQLSAKYPLFETMNATAEKGAFAAPKTSQWSTILEVLATHVQNALTGSEAPQAALDSAKKEIDAVL